jgi:hypothetical protein
MKEQPAFHRLTIDFEKELYAKLKALANENDRSASKQAKAMLRQALEKKGKVKDG